jgi:hypothetical protein
LDGKKLLKIIGLATGALLLVAMSFIAWFFYAMGQYTDKEIGRFPNLKGSIEAVVVERNGGATTTFVTLIYIVPRGAKPKDDPHFLADYVTGLEVQWLSDDKVLVRADNARIFEISYYYMRDTEIIATLEYEIRRIGRRNPPAEN